MIKANKYFYFSPEERLSEPATKSKWFITKVMSMTAVARQRYGFHRERRFDEKIYIWRLICKQNTEKDRKNRKKTAMGRKKGYQ